MKLPTLALMVGCLLLAACVPELRSSHAALWFSPDERHASVELDNRSAETIDVTSVRVEGPDWDRFTIRSEASAAQLAPGESLVVALEAEPRPHLGHNEPGHGYASYEQSTGSLLVAHDDTFTRIDLRIQTRPSLRAKLSGLAGWIWTVALAIAGLGLGGAAPRQRWADFDRATRAAWVLVAGGLALGGSRFGLCTYAWTTAVRAGDLAQCAAGRGGNALTMLPPMMAAALGLVALVWLMILARTGRDTAAALAVGLLAFAWILPPMGPALALVDNSGPTVSQPVVLGFASAFWVVGIAVFTRAVVGPPAPVFDR